MKEINANLILTIVSIILSAGMTMGYIKTSMSHMERQLASLTDKVEKHNNYGLRIVELETKIIMLEKQLERKSR